MLLRSYLPLAILSSSGSRHGNNTIENKTRNALASLSWPGSTCRWPSAAPTIGAMAMAVSQSTADAVFHGDRRA